MLDKGIVVDDVDDELDVDEGDKSPNDGGVDPTLVKMKLRL